MSVFETPTIETERLVMRPLSVSDAEDVFKWTGDERVAEYMLWPVHPDISITKAWLESLSALENEYVWGLVRKTDGELIGACSIRYRENEGAWSFGYNIRYDCWNQGYATEAAKRMTSYVRENNGARNFVAEHAVDNPASGRVIEKCGLKFAGYGEYTTFDGTKTFKAKIYELKE